MAAVSNVVKIAVLCGIYDSKKIAGARINVFGLYLVLIISERLISLLCIAKLANIVVTSVVYFLGLLRYLLE